MHALTAGAKKERNGYGRLVFMRPSSRQSRTFDYIDLADLELDTPGASGSNIRRKKRPRTCPSRPLAVAATRCSTLAGRDTGQFARRRETQSFASW